MIKQIQNSIFFYGVNLEGTKKEIIISEAEEANKLIDGIFI